MAFTIGTAALREGVRGSAGASVRGNGLARVKDGGQEPDSGTLLAITVGVWIPFRLDSAIPVKAPSAVDAVFSMDKWERTSLETCPLTL